jgi:hypothetical protein
LSIEENVREVKANMFNAKAIQATLSAHRKVKSVLLLLAPLGPLHEGGYILYHKERIVVVLL